MKHPPRRRWRGIDKLNPGGYWPSSEPSRADGDFTAAWRTKPTSRILYLLATSDRLSLKTLEEWRKQVSWWRDGNGSYVWSFEEMSNLFHIDAKAIQLTTLQAQPSFFCVCSRGHLPVKPRPQPLYITLLKVIMAHFGQFYRQRIQNGQSSKCFKHAETRSKLRYRRRPSTFFRWHQYVNHDLLFIVGVKHCICCRRWRVQILYNYPKWERLQWHSDRWLLPLQSVTLTSDEAMYPCSFFILSHLPSSTLSFKVQEVIGV